MIEFRHAGEQETAVAAGGATAHFTRVDADDGGAESQQLVHAHEA